LRHLGAELSSRGIAVWSIGYRRATEEGGGYPGTYQDVAAAIDRLRADAARYNMDLSRTVMVGHSAGGHLALWAASRGSLPAESSLFRPDPFIPKAVISVAGVGDLRSFGKFVPVICEPGILEKLIGTSEGATNPRYAEVSPADMGAPPGSVILVNGILDPIVPPFSAFDYARAMRAKRQDPVEMVEVSEVGHFDFFVPGTSAWALLNQRIDKELGLRR
jgi:acetyl esterase/lipase